MRKPAQIHTDNHANRNKLILNLVAYLFQDQKPFQSWKQQIIFPEFSIFHGNATQLFFHYIIFRKGLELLLKKESVSRTRTLQFVYFTPDVPDFDNESSPTPPLVKGTRESFIMAQPVRRRKVVNIHKWPAEHHKSWAHMRNWLRCRDFFA